MILGVNEKGNATKSLVGVRIDLVIEVECGFAGVCCLQRRSIIEFRLQLRAFVDVQHTCISMRQAKLLA